MYCNNLSRRLGSRQIFSKLTVTDPLIESILFSRLLANLRGLFADGGMEYRATERAPAAGGGSSFGAGVESSQ